MRLLRLLPLVLLAIQFRIPAAWACSCAVPEPAEMFEHSEAAYVGEVISIGGALGCGGSARIEVVEAFKNAEVGEVIVLPVNVGMGLGDCSIGDNPFRKGEEWLLYNREQSVSLCSGHSLASESEADIEILRELSEG